MNGEPIRAAVISDTHGLLRPEVERILQSCDAVIHAGDFDNQMIFHKLKIKRPLYAVRGNNDDDWAEQLPLIRRFKLGDFQFLLVHDQSDIPRDISDVEVVVFGHSHMHFQQQRNGRLWLNPGSCGYRRFTLPLSMAVLTLEEERCQIETFFLIERGESIEIEKDTAWFAKPEKPAVSAGGGQQQKVQEGCREQPGNSAEQPETIEQKKERSGMYKRVRNRITEGSKQKDQLFVIAKIMRLMKRGEPIDWVAKNLKLESGFVETIYRICVTHPQADAHQILDKLEVNHLSEHR